VELITIDHPQADLLRHSAAPVSFPLSAEVKALVADMLQFVADNQSAGIAAPQCGHALRIIVLQILEIAKQYRPCVYDVLPPTVFINPSFTPVPKDGRYKDWEGCYSVPGKMGEVTRYHTICYNAMTPQGKPMRGTARGIFARVIQHETGHLNGELYTDLIDDDCRFGDIDTMRALRDKELMETV